MAEVLVLWKYRTAKPPRGTLGLLNEIARELDNGRIFRRCESGVEWNGHGFKNLGLDVWHCNAQPDDGDFYSQGRANVSVPFVAVTPRGYDDEQAMMDPAYRRRNQWCGFMFDSSANMDGARDELAAACKRVANRLGHRRLFISTDGTYPVAA